ALLPETEISQILQFNPEIRIILLLRDPVERALSALRMIGAHAPEAVPFMDQIIEEPSFVARGLYQDFVPRWMSLVPPDQLLIARSEQISQNPQAFIDRLSAFLGVDPTGFNPTRVKGRRHVGSKDVLIPDAVKDTLEQKFALSRAYLEEVAPMS
ncbi:MAG: sulfotransferase, partial [Maritimibacter sp.]|nr:sulfotransferase [Maritimibacter sp.]